ncbi:MAG: hypothetical protein GDA39_07785 [Hyphomonadaceae bacterium]|nr:hypothetical protein [Hyphomonadaceae bacterium]MBC6412767.1 hypothetical protein [Hyphomonadaceae bacterium]
MNLRMRRSISWIGRAETCDDNDHYARLVFLWIAFNAAYVDEHKPQFAGAGKHSAERRAFQTYFRKLVAEDRERRIYNALWHKFSGPIRTLMRERSVYGPYWQHYMGVDGYADWERWFRGSRRSFLRAFQKSDTPKVLGFVFDRLYVLRNRLIHGGLTWDSDSNRAQVRDGAAILTFLIPVFIDLMMDDPQKDWGHPFYPVVE